VFNLPRTSPAHNYRRRRPYADLSCTGAAYRGSNTQNPYITILGGQGKNRLPEPLRQVDLKMGDIVSSRDEKSYAYTYHPALSTEYLVQGIR
jgi:hypothetical protein